MKLIGFRLPIASYCCVPSICCIYFFVSFICSFFCSPLRLLLLLRSSFFQCIALSIKTCIFFYMILFFHRVCVLWILLCISVVLTSSKRAMSASVFFVLFSGYPVSFRSFPTGFFCGPLSFVLSIL